MAACFSYQSSLTYTGLATFANGVYSCPGQTDLIMLTVDEVNALPRSGVPEKALLSENFFGAFVLVLSCYVLGKFVGSILSLIKGDNENAF